MCFCNVRLMKAAVGLYDSYQIIDIYTAIHASLGGDQDLRRSSASMDFRTKAELL